LFSVLVSSKAKSVLSLAFFEEEKKREGEGQ
jgi:hypothetical protein